MSRKREPKVPPMLIGFEPWRAAGPGWQNSGVTFLFEDRIDGKLSRRTVYERDLPAAWLGVAITAYHQLVTHSAPTPPPKPRARKKVAK